MKFKVCRLDPINMAKLMYGDNVDFEKYTTTMEFDSIEDLLKVSNGKSMITIYPENYHPEWGNDSLIMKPIYEK